MSPATTTTPRGVESDVVDVDVDVDEDFACVALRSAFWVSLIPVRRARLRDAVVVKRRG